MRKSFDLTVKAASTHCVQTDTKAEHIRYKPVNICFNLDILKLLGPYLKGKGTSIEAIITLSICVHVPGWLETLWTKMLRRMEKLNHPK